MITLGAGEEVECAPADPAGGEALPGEVAEQEMLVTGVGAEHDALHPALAALVGCRTVLHAENPVAGGRDAIDLQLRPGAPAPGVPDSTSRYSSDGSGPARAVSMTG